MSAVIAFDEKLCARGTRLLCAVASEAEDMLALLPAVGEPAVGAPDGGLVPRATSSCAPNPSATVAFYPLIGEHHHLTPALM